MTEAPSGQILTFYSYKGGTGRSMALANVGCLLAQELAGRGNVLAIDWDLEAPGLHRFFRGRFERSLGNDDEKLDRREGLIDLFNHFVGSARKFQSPGEADARALVRDTDFGSYVIPTDVPGLSLMKAGRFDAQYSSRVNTFDWRDLYNRLPWLIRALGDRLSTEYRYILIDSRTGLTDSSGICTMILPEKLVVVFTPNRQSLLGVKEVVRRAAAYRRKSSDLRPLAVFPLPSRIEATAEALRRDWRMGSADGDVEGYQPLMEHLLEEVYELPRCPLNRYFENVQIQHVPEYAYGEQIAVLQGEVGDRLSLQRSYRTFKDALLKLAHPAEAEMSGWPGGDAPEPSAAAEAEAVFSSLSASDQEIARRVMLRLIRIGSGGLLTKERARMKDLPAGSDSVISAFKKSRVLEEAPVAKEGAPAIEIKHEAVVQNWPRLKTWVDQNLDFLEWRQSLQSAMRLWELNKRHSDGLLRGQAMSSARSWQKERAEDLIDEEAAFIHQSAKDASPLRSLVSVMKNLRTSTALSVVVALSGVVAFAAAFLWGGPKRDDSLNLLIQSLQSELAAERHARQVESQKADMIAAFGVLTSADSPDLIAEQLAKIEASAAPGDPLLIRAYSVAGQAFGRANALPQAEATLLKGVALIEKTKGPVSTDLIPLLMFTGLAQIREHRPEAADQTYDRVVSLAERGSVQPQALIDAIEQSATCKLQLHKYDKALALSQRSLDLQQKLRNPDNFDMARTLDGMAEAFNGLNQTEKANETRARAESLRRSSGKSGAALEAPAKGRAKE
jgi:cellulose biosynthesis protein BcsQ